MGIQLEQGRIDFQKYYDFRHGNMAALFTGQPTETNGLAYIPASEVSTHFNYFAAQSRFYSDAMLADIPSDLGAFYNPIYQGIRDWTVTGESVFLLYGERLVSIQPRYFFPVRSRDNDQEFERYLFVFPILNEQRISTNKARVIDIDAKTGAATESVRDYGYGMIAETGTGTVSFAYSGMAWIRTDDGVYGEMEGLVREINMRMSMLQVSMNTNTFPLLQVDIDNVSDGAFALKDANRSRIARRGLGMTVPPPFVGEEGARFVERLAPQTVEALEFLRLLLGQLSIISGVPDYVYGVNLGQPAAETERILFAGQSKINRYRQALIDGLAAMGIELEFNSEPFVTRKQKIETLMMLLENGVITAQEVRMVLGFA